jgi:Glycosyltransferase family 87
MWPSIIRSTPNAAILRIARSPLFWLGLQVPIFAALYFIYSRRPVADPTVVNYDVRLYFDAASAVLRGQLPYRDFFFQYPPLALLFFIPPRLFASDLASYFRWFNLELLLLACAGVVITAKIAVRIGQPVGTTLLVYSLALIAIGAIIPQRYDLAPAILVLLAIAAWLDEKDGLAFGFLAIGTLVKIYPALLVPLFLIAGWRGHAFRAALRGLLIYVGMILVIMLPFLLFAPRETVSAIAGQAGRGVGIASLYASLLLVGRPLGVPAEIVYQQGLNSWNVDLPGAEWVVSATTGLQLISVALVYLRAGRLPNLSGSTFVRFSAAVVGVALVASKVLSAQYILWLFPLGFLGGEKRFAWDAAFFLTAATLTQLLFPFLWSDLKQGSNLALMVALARDACLVGLCLLLVETPAVLNHLGIVNQGASQLVD